MHFLYFHFKHRNNLKENMGYHGAGSIAPVLYVVFRGGGLVLLWYFLTLTVILLYIYIYIY